MQHLELVRTRSNAPAAKEPADELESDLVDRSGAVAAVSGR
jgi:hypothetical protein